MAQAKIRMYLRVASVVLIGAVVGAFAAFGPRGVAVAIPAAAAFWFFWVSPRYKRRYLTDLSDLPSWDLKASDDGSSRGN